MVGSVNLYYYIKEKDQLTMVYFDNFDNEKKKIINVFFYL
jgi:hypothetical protein